MTLGVMGRRLGLATGWVGRAVETPAAQGLPIRDPGNVDRRAMIEALSEEGQTRLAELDAQANGFAERVSQRIPAGRRSGGYSALKGLAANLLGEARAGFEPVAPRTRS
jgi:DNA-binding MarR family transcriptional regulator